MKFYSKSDINNNSAKSERTPEVNDDDDVETVQTAEAESLLPEEHLQNNTDDKPVLEQDYPSDPNETDQVS